MVFELTNAQREHFGFHPVEKGWEAVILKGDKYRSDSLLYFEGDTIKRWITSTADEYAELQYDEQTKGRTLLLPKTGKGKPQKLSAAVLEKRQPFGVYLRVNTQGDLRIGNFSTQTTFYDSHWESPDDRRTAAVPEQILRFIATAPPGHREQIESFKKATRRHIKFQPGDYFSLKLNRTQFGFGRVLLDIAKIKKSGLISKEHGLHIWMGQPVLIQMYAHASTSRSVLPADLEKHARVPSDVIMDNVLLYGEFEIMGHQELAEEEFEFPLAYGRSRDATRLGIVYLNWGLIHRELPLKAFSKYLVEEDRVDPADGTPEKTSPFAYAGIGFRPHYDTIDILDAARQGAFDYARNPTYTRKYDLRNPKNTAIRAEILKAFGLDPKKSYPENCLLTGTPKTTDLLRRLK